MRASLESILADMAGARDDSRQEMFLTPESLLYVLLPILKGPDTFPVPIARVLEHLGIASKLRGPGAQKRCPCPIHRADGRGRTFSVNLRENAFFCFDPACQKKGDVIDLWAALHSQSVRQAALDLACTFDLEPARTEKRHG